MVSVVAGLNDVCAVVEHGLEKLVPRPRELVGELFRLALGENAVLVPLGDVGPPALHELGGKPRAQG